MRSEIRLALGFMWAATAALAVSLPAVAEAARRAPIAAQAPHAVQAPIQAPPGKSPQQAPAQPQTITKTVLVPQITYKTMTVPTTVCRPEVRQQQVTVCRLVPETKMTTVHTTVMFPEQWTEQVAYTDCRLTFQDVTRTVTVMVPHVETRQGVRAVCKPVAVQTTRTVCRDVGHWATQQYVDVCGCVQCCKVWVPKVVTEQVPVTVYRPQIVEELYTYQDVVCRPETRQVVERVAKPVYETKTRNVTYTVGVPTTVERQMPQTRVRPVLENRTVSYTVMVPQQIERQVTVPVCTLVPKQVTYTVAPCADCGPGGGCGGAWGPVGGCGVCR